jgi:hypothetical protein
VTYFSSAFSSAFTLMPLSSPRPTEPARVPIDIRTGYIDLDHGIDWAMDGADLAADHGLTTAVVISLSIARWRGRFCIKTTPSGISPSFWRPSGCR